MKHHLDLHWSVSNSGGQVTFFNDSSSYSQTTTRQNSTPTLHHPTLISDWSYRATSALEKDHRQSNGEPSINEYHNNDTRVATRESVSLEIRPVQQFTSTQVFFGFEQELQIAQRHLFDALPQRHLAAQAVVGAGGGTLQEGIMIESR